MNGAADDTWVVEAVGAPSSGCKSSTILSQNDLARMFSSTHKGKPTSIDRGYYRLPLHFTLTALP